MTTGREDKSLIVFSRTGSEPIPTAFGASVYYLCARALGAPTGIEPYSEAKDGTFDPDD